MRSLIALAALVSWIAMGVGAQVYDLTLFHTDPEALSPEVKIHYDQAVEAVDRIDYIAALRQMGMAAEAAPDSPELQAHYITLALRTVRPDRSISPVFGSSITTWKKMPMFCRM